jgi:aryl-alcohol dehydrogenase-like predicted oxidoreductase
MEVSILGFGCGPSARLMVGDDIDLQVQTVRAAIESGINFFDTAAAYGDGRSETNLGRALQLADAHPLVSSKVLIADSDLADIKGAALDSVQASLKRLRLTRLDGLILHNRVAWDRDPDRIVGIGPLLSVEDILGPGGYAEAVAELRASGVVRTFGFTAFGGQADAVDEIAQSGCFDAINADFSAANPSAGFALGVPDQPDYRSVIDRTRAHGLSTMAIRVLGNGRLVNPTATRTATESQVATWLAATSGSVVAGAIRFVLSKPGVANAVIGFSAPQHVRQAAHAAAAGPLVPTQLRELRRLHARNDTWLAASRGDPVGRIPSQSRPSGDVTSGTGSRRD